MTRLVISGYYGFGNAGDEAMLAAILEAILEVIPDADITVISGNPKQTAQYHGVKAVGRFDMFGILNAIRRCDLLLSGGGSLLQDVTSKRSLYYYLSVISLANVLNKPVMLYAQGIGPLRRKQARKMVGQVLNKVTMITVRDEKSKLELESMGVTDTPIEVTADAVLAMHPVDITIGKRLLQEHNLSGVRYRIGISVRQWKDFRAYRQELADALDLLHEELDAQIIFIPMQHPADTNEAKSIAQLMRHEPIVLESVYTTTELLALEGCMDLIIGVRLHALVFGTVMEKPVVGISYDPKITNFLHMIGQEPVGTLDSLQGVRIFKAAASFLEDETLLQKSLERVAQLREESLKNAHIALSLLSKNK